MGKSALKYYYNGTRYKITELAELAGCTGPTMRARLKKMEPDEAVAMGPHPKIELNKYGYRGGLFTAAELAEKAGCSEHAMYVRLSKMDAEAAVAMGKERTKQKVKAELTDYADYFEYRGCLLTAREIALVENISLKKLNHALDCCRTLADAIKKAKEE